MDTPFSNSCTTLKESLGQELNNVYSGDFEFGLIILYLHKEHVSLSGLFMVVLERIVLTLNEIWMGVVSCLRNKHSSVLVSLTDKNILLCTEFFSLSYTFLSVNLSQGFEDLFYWTILGMYHRNWNVPYVLGLYLSVLEKLPEDILCPWII